MTRTIKRSKDLRKASTSGIVEESLSRYVDGLFRRVSQGWPLTLSEYIRAEESLTASTSWHLANAVKEERVTLEATFVGQPHQLPWPTAP
jgi:hypothetical protein